MDRKSVNYFLIETQAQPLYSSLLFSNTQTATSVIGSRQPWSIPWKTPLFTGNLRKTIWLAVEASVGEVPGG